MHCDDDDVPGGDEGDDNVGGAGAQTQHVGGYTGLSTPVEIRQRTLIFVYGHIL